RRANPELRASLAPAESRLVIHVSNFRPVKRILDCIRILAKIKLQLPARLIMCGDGPERSAAEQEAEACGVAGDVVFAGQIPNIHDYLSVADLLLLPSESE